MARLFNLYILLFIQFSILHHNYGEVSPFEKTAPKNFENLQNLEVRFVFKLCQKLASSHFDTFHFSSTSENSPLITTMVLSLDLISTMHPPSKRLTTKNIAVLNIIDLTQCDTEEILDALKYAIKPSRYLHKTRDFYIFITQEQMSINTFPVLEPPLNQIQKKVVLQIENESVAVWPLCYFCNQVSMTNPNAYTIALPPKPDLLSFLQQIFPKTSPTFSGRSFKITCSTSVRVRITLRPSPKGDGSWIINPGIFEKLHTQLTRKLNFTAVFQHASGGAGTGKKLANNGTWVGVVGDIYNELAEIGILAGNSLERSRLVTLTSPLEYQSAVMITGRHYEVLSWKLLSAPLGKRVWIFLGISIIVAIIFIYGTQELFKTYIFPYLSPSERSAVRLWRNGEIVENTLAAFFDQDVPLLSPRPLKLFLVLWLFVSMIISNVYQSKLYATLAFPPILAQPKNFHELVTSPTTNAWGLDYIGDMVFQVLKNSDSPVIQKVFNEMDVHRDSVKCLKQVVIQNYVCITYTTIVDLISARNFSSGVKSIMKESSFSTYTAGLSLILGKDSPLETLFNQQIGVLVSQGLPVKWMDMFHGMMRRGRNAWVAGLKRVGKSPPNILSEEQEHGNSGGAVKISLKKLQGAYFALFVGLCVASGGFFWEFRSRLRNAVRDFKLRR